MARGPKPYLASVHGYRAHKRRRLAGLPFLLRHLQRRPGLLFLAALGAFVAWEGFENSAGSPTSAASAVVGRASVIDGDTIEIRGERIRLHGIDAPESQQLCQDGAGRDYRCGRSAATALEQRVRGQTVSCDGEGTDRYGRLIAVCTSGDEDLNRWLVREGWAVAYTRYSIKYVPAEVAARVARRGLWSGAFTEPEAWRRRHRR